MEKAISLNLLSKTIIGPYRWRVVFSLFLVFAAETRVRACVHDDGSSRPPRPNIVWLISEDNSKHFLRLFDDAGAETPNIAQLAEHGLIFERAFSNSPVCSVARSTLITGCYAPRIGTQFHRRSAMVPLPSGLRQFPAYLRQAGYYTTNNKKTDYNCQGMEQAWDESSGQASWKNRAAGQPFFHVQSFPATHEGRLHFPAVDVTNRATTTDPETVFVQPRHPRSPLFKYTYARYHDQVKQVDRQIGQLVDELQNDHVLEHTFVFYFSDHGGVLPGSKGYLYETGLHVPLVVRVPESWQHVVDFPIRSRVSGFVSFVDFGPTVLHLAGIEVPFEMDGQPFLGAGIQASLVNSRNSALGYADRFDEKIDLVRSLRVGNYKYVRSFQPFNFDGLQNNYRYKMAAYAQWRQWFAEGRLNAVQEQFFRRRPAESLFDLEKDPYELRNLAGEQDRTGTLVELRTRLQMTLKSMPDTSMFPESFLAGAAFSNPAEFGRRRAEQIGQLIDIADLSLLPFAQAESRIRAAVNSPDAWQRYWAMICCSSFGKRAGTLRDAAQRLLDDDTHRGVRVRAAEFLGLIEALDPMEHLYRELSQSESALEAGEILNSIVMLRDGQPGYATGGLTVEHIPSPFRQADNVKRRLAYLLSADGDR